MDSDRDRLSVTCVFTFYLNRSTSSCAFDEQTRTDRRRGYCKQWSSRSNAAPLLVRRYARVIAPTRFSFAFGSFGRARFVLVWSAQAERSRKQSEKGLGNYYYYYYRRHCYSSQTGARASDHCQARTFDASGRTTGRGRGGFAVARANGKKLGRGRANTRGKQKI